MDLKADNKIAITMIMAVVKTAMTITIREVNRIKMHSSSKEEKNIFPAWRVNFFQAAESVTIEHGLDFILEHFLERSLPRSVSTAVTKDSQKAIYDKQRALLYFNAALRQNCKISVYPDYEEAINVGMLPGEYRPKPTHLFIDIDLSVLGGNKDLLTDAIVKTCENIKLYLGNDASPTIIATGGGCHIHQPLDPESVPVFEELPMFAKFKDPSIKFLRYAAKKLTGEKSDPSHNVSFASCMTRVPGSLNTKYEEVVEVKILQRWNGVRAKPTKQFLYLDFLTYLAKETDRHKQREEKAKRRQRAYAAPSNRSTKGPQIVAPDTGDWREKLLQAGIEDGRKRVIYWVLAPYLINVRGLGYDQAYRVLVGHASAGWLDKCDKLRQLQPSWDYFEDRVYRCLRHSLDSGMRPSGIDALKEHSPDLYDQLSLIECSEGVGV